MLLQLQSPYGLLPLQQQMTTSTLIQSKTGLDNGERFILLSLGVAITRHVRQYHSDKEARNAQIQLLDKLSSAQHKIQELEELNAPVRKVIFRFIFKREPQILTTKIDVWKKTSDFEIFRYRIRVKPNDYGYLVADRLKTDGDASFSLTPEGGSFQAASEDEVIEDLPEQYRSAPLFAFFETRIAVEGNLFVRDLVGASIYFQFECKDRRYITAEVLKEIDKIQIYAQVTDSKVVICTYDISHDAHLPEIIEKQEKETVIEEDGYLLHVWPSHQRLDMSGGLGIRLAADIFKVVDVNSVLDELPDFP